LAHPEDAGVRRAAEPSFDDSVDEAVISRRLVTEILNASAQIRPLDKETASTLRTTKEVNGYIYLKWCTIDGSGTDFRTLFYVSSEYQPRFDVVLGREGTKLLEI
jgi:hypothetical protein